MKRTVILSGLLLMTHLLFAADLITLTNQMVFAGKVKKIDQCMVKFRCEGNVFHIPGNEISSIVFEDPEDKALVAYQNLQDPEKCLKGRQDASLYHGKVGGHIALGALFGPFAIAGAAISTPSPVKGKDTYLMSKNREIFDDPAYLTCYRKSAKGKNVGNTALGWGAWILFLLAI